MKKARKANLPALIFLFALLLLWQAGAAEMGADYILPTPVQILQRLWELREPLFLVHLPATMTVTGIGLAMMAAAPISMASHAWEGRPIPASTMMGRSISSMRIWMNSRVASPLLEPMGDARGITAAAPAFTRSRAVFRSGYM